MNYACFGMKNVGLRKVEIQNWDHLNIKTISAGPTGGLNCEVPLYCASLYTGLKLFKTFRKSKGLLWAEETLNQGPQERKWAWGPSSSLMKRLVKRICWKILDIIIFFIVVVKIKWMEGVSSSVHGKEKYTVGPVDQLLKKAAGPQQKLPVHTLDWIWSFTRTSRIQKIPFFNLSFRHVFFNANIHFL